MLKNIYGVNAERKCWVDNQLREIELELIRRIDQVACFLMRSKPMVNTSREMRFGRKGGLCIQKTGPKAGCFKDFDSGEGGDIFGLIMYIQDCSFKEALQWARDFLGKRCENYQLREVERWYSSGDDRPQRWSQISPVPKGVKIPTAADIEKDRYLCYMLKDGKRIERLHVYRTGQGIVSHLVVRLLDCKGDKLTLPLTLHQNAKGFYLWKWKGLSGLRPLFGLEKLTTCPERKVLLVEGEKTAEAAQLLYPDLAVLTWSNGAGAVHKADWSPLAGREVVIWPDNDTGGVKAAKQIRDILRELNNDKGRVEIVAVPEGFPRKWDLADPFPNGWNSERTRGVIDGVFGKGVEDGEKPVVSLKRATIELPLAVGTKKRHESKTPPNLNQSQIEKACYVERPLKLPNRDLLSVQAVKNDQS